MVRRTKEDAQETRNRILDTAVEVFNRQGVAQTSLNDIARETGVTRGAIYWHFANKVDLFNAMIERLVCPLLINSPEREAQLTADPPACAAAGAAEAGDKARPVLLICRSGKRTLDAGAALHATGFAEVAHVVHGFEGDLDDAFKRSTVNGWRHDGLPWEQM